MSGRPRLSIVLHTHMPYVEGFGTWPFGEEWLWEAMATSYLPLVELLDRRPGRVTVSLTPVLADQLHGPGVAERFDRFLGEVRTASHALDLHDEPDPRVRAELERSAARYARMREVHRRFGGDLVAALAPHVSWTSAATHAVLPLLATDAGVRLQLHTGIGSHERRFGAWGGGLWLPECAHAPWLDPLLAEAGVRVACVDWTDLGVRGGPRRTPSGVVLVPIDREIVELVWGAGGYPSQAPYLDTHHTTARKHRAWSVGGTPYDPAAAERRLRADARDFVEHVQTRDGLCVCALDTELLGHWWSEGVEWLEAVLDAAEAMGLEVLPLDAALAEAEAEPLGAPPPVTTWGTPRDLSTWSRAAAGRLAWRQRRAELDVVTRGAAVGERAVRELLALQASDWAFLVTRQTAGDYPLERAAGHEAALRAALAGDAAGDIRNLAPRPALSALVEPGPGAFRPAAGYPSPLAVAT